MKKILISYRGVLITLISLFVCVCAGAQEKVPVSLALSSDYCVATNDFKQNWVVETAKAENRTEQVTG